MSGKIDWKSVAKKAERTFGKTILLEPGLDDETRKEFEEDVEKLYQKMYKAGKKEGKIPTEAGFLVSESILSQKGHSRQCETCGKLTFDMNDDVYLVKHKCCYICYIKHIEGR